jgi:uncharacterized protein YjgD (DUF1641 family)
MVSVIKITQITSLVNVNSLKVSKTSMNLNELIDLVRFLEETTILPLFLSKKMPNVFLEKLTLENMPPLKVVELHAGNTLTVLSSFMTAKMVNASRN